MKKRFLALMLAVTMMVSVIEPMTNTVYAATAPQLVASYVSDEYGNLIKDTTDDATGSQFRLYKASSVDSDLPAEPSSDECANAQMFSSTIIAGNYLREQMKQRSERIVFALDRDTYDDMKDDGTISAYHQAIMHTGNPQEGDYLYNQLHYTKAAAWKFDDKAVYVYDIIYRTSLDEEQEVTAAIEQMEKVIPWGTDTTDVEKSAVREIYRYICDYFSYDYDSYQEYLSIKDDADYKQKMSKTAIQSHTAYGAYKQRKAVCQGLADLIYRLCLDRGIDCRIMRSGTHAWNAVEIDGKWYMCDATGDVQKSSYNYDNYLLARADLIDYDLKNKVDTYKWQDESLMWDWEVVNGYDWAVFEYNSLISTVCRGFKKTVTLSKSNKEGEQSIKLYDKDGNLLVEGTDYTISYEKNYGSNKDKYNTQMIITGIGKYAGSEIVKYYNQKMKAPTIKRVTYKVIKKNVKGAYTKPYDVIQYKVYFDGVAGAYQYRIYNSEYDILIGYVHGGTLKKTKNGEYCYTFEYEKLAGKQRPIKICIEAIGKNDMVVHKGDYEIKVIDSKKVKKNKTVTLKKNNGYKNKTHKDCKICKTCNHMLYHDTDDIYIFRATTLWVK